MADRVRPGGALDARGVRRDPARRRRPAHRARGRSGLRRCGTRATAAGGLLRVGVDLGTATCVLVVLDAAGRPVWVDDHPSGALRDGVVVDFAAATAAVRHLKVPRRGRRWACRSRRPPRPTRPASPCATPAPARYVCEAAGFDDVVLVDEVTAAQRTLDVRDGVVVDVGGGSTGVGVFRGGELDALDDRPGGGHHLDLVLAGALGLTVEQAEVAQARAPGRGVADPRARPAADRASRSEP